MKGRFQLITDCDEFGALLHTGNNGAGDEMKKVKDGNIYSSRIA